MVVTMRIKEIEASIEGILFAAGEAVSLNALCEALEIDKITLKSIMKRLMDYYQFERRGIQIIEIEDAYQLCTRPEYYKYIKKLTRPKPSQYLSGAALETLAIIAYNQPVTRSNIEQIRGVNSDGSLNKLIERGLVEEKGRLDAPGKPILFGTTQSFLRCFGFKSIEDLPDIDNNQHNDQLKIQEKV